MTAHPNKIEEENYIQPEGMSFWEHLDELRASLIKIIIATIACSIIAFLFKDEVFSIILAPKNDHFITYRLLNMINRWATGMDSTGFSVSLINTGLAEQFIIHMKTSLYTGLLLSSPYILYILFHFISPALYSHERKYSVRVAGGGYIMFMAGASLNYFLIFPLTFRFLGTYQVSTEVTNMISLQSYMDTLLMMSLWMGILFELPVICWLMGKLGVLSASFMRRFRKHSIIVILIIAAIITPTSDVFTLTLVSFPIWILYEASIWIVAKVYPDSQK